MMGCVFLLSTIDELSQAFIPSRTFSFADLTASVLGIIFLGLIGHRINRQRD
jgi:VanZ family protein